MTVHPTPKKSRLAIVLAFTFVAHAGALAAGAWLSPPPPKDPTRLARVLVGHFDEDRGDLAIDGYATARLRNP